MLRRWWPICTSLPLWRAASTISRLLSMVLAISFSQYTCRPALRQANVMGACIQSGVATMTASMPFSLASISPYSVYTFTGILYFLRMPAP